MAPPKKAAGFDGIPTAGKVFILMVVVGVVAGIYYLALHSGLSDSLQSAQNRHRDLETQYGEAERRQQEFLRVSQELAAREGIDRRNKEILPEDAEMAAFLDDLNRIAELSNLELQVVEPRPEEAEELYTRLPVDLTVRGAFHEVAKFTHATSQLRRAVNLEDIHLKESQRQVEAVQANREDGAGAVPELDVTFTATTFRRPSAETANAPGAAR
ncbi:MAG: type 4a pilus biogenesis protein PilO [Deltaproteobacteria bacterium]|nr:type 4a pilus biogenesis protein PilO [Deltaproteobacteria bacterium]